MLSRRLVCEVIGNPQSQTSLRMDSQTPHYKLQMAAIDGGPAQLALLKTELVPAGATLGTVKHKHE